MNSTFWTTIHTQRSHTFRVFISILFACYFLTSQTYAGKLSDYLSVDAYYDQHPEQRPLREALSDAVANAPALIRTATDSIVTTADASGTTSERRPRIAVLYPGIQLSDYWQRSIAALESRLKQLQIHYELQVRFTRPGTQLLQQETELQTLLAWQPDYLIYTVDSAAQQSIVERLIHRGTPKVILQNITTPIQAWGEKQPFLYTGFDHMEGARLLAHYFRKHFPRGSEYGVLFWSHGTVSDMRGMAFIQSIDNYHTLKGSYYTQADQESAYRATLDMLSKPNNIRYIYVCATDLAVGAAKALKELDREDISLNGWGGGLTELNMLRQGNLDVVLMRMNDDSSIAIAEAIKRDLENSPVPLIYTGKFTILDSRTTENDINTLLNQAFRYSR